MTLRVGYDAYAFRMQNYGGVSKVFAELINGINGSRVSRQMQALLIEHLPSSWSNRINAESLAIDNTKYRNVNRLIRRIPRRDLIDLDLLHLTYYQKNFLVAPGVPFAITVHDFTPEIYPEFFGNSNPHLDKMSLIERADLLFCVSKFTKEILVESFPKIDSNRIRVCYLGPSIVKSERKIVSSLPYFLIVGRNDRYKNLDLIFKMIEVFPHHQFVFFGMDSSQIPFGLRKYIGSRILCADGDSELLAMYYRGAEAFITATHSEGFCIPVLDALISGCPAVVSDLPVFREIYGDSVTYFDQTDPKSLARTLKTLKGKRLKPFDNSKYTWAKFVDGHINAYLDFLGEKIC